MQNLRTRIAGRRSVAALAVRAAVAAGCALFLCGCNTDQQAAAVPDPPSDYRLRHPITLRESDHAIEVFIGSNRPELTPTQRAQVLSFGLGWKREATGGVIVERPVGVSNEQASSDAMREIASILAASGLPLQSIAMRTYPATSSVASIRISYPKVMAQAGPCGIWPEDIGPSMNRNYFENKQYWNFGCASQRNLAAMIDNPADLVQPRAETAAYAMRRSVVVEKYRTGQSPATQDSTSAQSAKITDIGK
jgi:pilus assembly protein CpaD